MVEYWIEKKHWGTLGTLNEQSIEGTHPEFNNISRLFGNLRVPSKNDKITKEFLLGRKLWRALMK